MSTKQCYGCHETKPLTEFNKYAASKDGHNVNCRECSRTMKRRAHAALMLREKALAEKRRRMNTVRTADQRIVPKLLSVFNQMRQK